MLLKYIILISLFIGWAFGYFCFSLGKEIHLLLGMAVIASSVIITTKDGNHLEKNKSNSAETCDENIYPVRFITENSVEQKSIIQHAEA